MAFGAWRHMKQRCLVPAYTGYKNYGGRGITVCERWLNSFESFLADMGDWATASQQQRNTRMNRLLEFRGRTQCIADWADEVNIPADLISVRLRNGWPIERALTVRDARRRPAILAQAGPTRSPELGL